MGAIASMTGYGRGEARGVRIAVLVEARSLNHRFLDLNLKLARTLSSHETDLRRLVQGRVTRGRVDVTVVTRRIGGNPTVVRTDVALGAEYLRGARGLAEAVGLPAAGVALSDLLRLPGVVTVEEAEEDEGENALLVKAAARDAIDELARMRQTEGAALVAELATHLELLTVWVGEMERLLPGAVERIQARMRERVRALLDEAPADPGRLAQEVAMWAAKSDVAEELSRLRSHIGQFQTLLADGGAIGRQLDFLAQELHREVNTIASKADDGDMITRVLAARALVERVREQVQNVE